MVKDSGGAGPAEGWDGTSIKDHFAGLEAVANEALELARYACDEAAQLRIEMDLLLGFSEASDD